MNQRKTVIFDMDGVIFDTENLCLKSWEYAADEYNAKDIAPVFKSVIGTTYDRTKEIVLDHYGKDFPYEDFRKKAGEYFYGYEQKYGMPMKPYVFEIMNWLKENGYTIALASSTYRVNVERELKGAGLFDYFASITCGDSVKRSKPEPDIYLLACESLGVKPEECYAVEDSINGVLSAYRAGINVIMVPDMLQPDEATKEKIVAKCDSLTDVIEFLKNERTARI